RNVELLATTVDAATGAKTTSVLTNDVSFPFDLSGRLPMLKLLDGANHVTLQIRATDTGGNVTLSDPLDVTLVSDTIPPRLVSQRVPDGGGVGPAVKAMIFDFSKPLDPATVSASTFGVIGPGGKPVSPVSVSLHGDNREVEVTFGSLLALGQYQLQIDAAHV